MTISEALRELSEGNARFAAGESHAVAKGGRGGMVAAEPFAAILGCVDSRVPLEIVFDQSIGKLFVARIAGNVVNDDILASLELAVSGGTVRVVLVVGHTDCAAVRAACGDAAPGHLETLLAKLRPAIESVAGVPDANDPDFVAHAAAANARHMVELVRARSEFLRTREQEGAVTLLAGLYDVESGEVRLL